MKLKFWNFLAYLSLPKAIFLKNATGNKRSTCLILPKRRGTRHNIILQKKRREKTKGIKKRRYKSRPLGGFSLLSTKSNLTFTLSRNHNKIHPENKIQSSNYTAKQSSRIVNFMVKNDKSRHRGLILKTIGQFPNLFKICNSEKSCSILAYT